MTLYDFPSCEIFASGADDPPPENTRPAAAAAGVTWPPGLARSDVSIGTQADPAFARTGVVLASSVKVPSGRAVTVWVGVVSDATSTGEPEAAAFAEAAASGDRSPAGAAAGRDVVPAPPAAEAGCAPTASSGCSSKAVAASHARRAGMALTRLRGIPNTRPPRRVTQRRPSVDCSTSAG
jgi:hypothetical protein